MKDLGDPNKFVEWNATLSSLWFKRKISSTTYLWLEYAVLWWCWGWEQQQDFICSQALHCTILLVGIQQQYNALPLEKKRHYPLQSHCRSHWCQIFLVSTCTHPVCHFFQHQDVWWRECLSAASCFKVMSLCPPAFFCTWGYLPILCGLAAASHQDFADLAGSKLTLLSDQMYKNWVCRNKSYGSNELDALSFTLITKYTSLNNTFQWNGAQHKASAYRMTESIL